MRECQCLLEEQDSRRAQEIKNLSNLDAFAHMTFQSFDASRRGTETAFAIAREYSKMSDGWLVLHGSVGVGKTHLAVAAANAYPNYHPNSSVYFQVVPDLLDQLRATFDPSHGVAFDDRFQRIRNAHLLVLDDLGTENTTPWASEKLYQLINHRYNERLSTIITTNVNSDQIEDRISSRIFDKQLSRYVFIRAADYRSPSRSDLSEMR
jgi:DNA replication protein DnaC